MVKEITLNSNQKEVFKRRFEEQTMENVKELDEELEDILVKVSNWDYDVIESKDLIMHKFLLFILHNKQYDELVIQKFSWEYFEKHKDKLIGTIP